MVNTVSVDWLEFTLFGFPKYSLECHTSAAFDGDYDNWTAEKRELYKSLLPQNRERIRWIERLAEKIRWSEQAVGSDYWNEANIDAIVDQEIEAKDHEEEPDQQWTVDLIPELLGLVKGAELEKQPRGNLGYLRQHTYLGARIYSRGSAGMGLHVSIGSEALAALSSATGRNPWHLLKMLYLAGAKMTRVDLAIDDKAGALDLKKMMTACQKGHCNSRLKEWQIIESGTNSTGEITGRTLYQGSRTADFYVRFYDKRLLSIKQGVPRGTLPAHWIRAESEIKGKAAAKIAALAHLGADLASVAKRLLAQYISFKTPSKTDKRKGRWPVAAWWSAFAGGDKLSISTPKAETTLSKSSRWFVKQCSRQFAVMLQAHGSAAMEEIYKSGAAAIKPGQWSEIRVHKARELAAAEKLREFEQNYAENSLKNDRKISLELCESERNLINHEGV